MYLYIGFKTFFYVVRHLDSVAFYLSTGLHLGFFRSWPSLFLPSLVFLRSSSRCNHVTDGNQHRGSSSTYPSHTA